MKSPIFTLFGSQDEERFYNLLTTHLQRCSNFGNAYARLVQRYFPYEIVMMIVSHAHEKMCLSKEDQQEHSFSICHNGACYCLCTLNQSVANAIKHFSARYGGYTRLINGLLASDQFKKNRCKLLFHFVYGDFAIKESAKEKESNCWIQMAIVPVKGHKGIGNTLPTDLLTKQEKQTYGFD